MNIKPDLDTIFLSELFNRDSHGSIQNSILPNVTNNFILVSFFGASHIAMPLQEAKISTNIRLRFRTHQDNALLLLAAGRTDYCLVGLDAGRIKFLFKVDDFVAEVH